MSLAGVLGFVPCGPLLTRRQLASPRAGFQERRTPLCPLCPRPRKDTPPPLPCSTGHTNNRRKDDTGCERQQVGLPGPPRGLATTIGKERRSGHLRSLLPINITWRLSRVVKKEKEIRAKGLERRNRTMGIPGGCDRGTEHQPRGTYPPPTNPTAASGPEPGPLPCSFPKTNSTGKELGPRRCARLS